MPFFFSSERDFTRERFVFAITVLLSTMVISASGQARLEATVTDTRGVATLIIGTSSRPILRGERLAPGNEIETGAGGRVILRLTDGCLVTIHPNSRVVIEDFRAAPSVRELIRVLAGYVRVKIYHTAKRPNPYRVNTPVASIAVRGTEFGVNVALTGETRVTVFEGLVEVTSQINPQQKRLLTPGRSIVVRPSGDIGLLAPGPGSELNALGSYPPNEYQSQAVRASSEYVLQTLSPSVTTPFMRFLAFNDSHFDSLENPAYAGGFKRPDGRLYLLASLASTNRLRDSELAPLNSRVRPFNYSAAHQTSFFTPIKNTRNVVGGSLTIAHTDLEAGISELKRANHILDFTSSLNLTTSNLSLIAARRFGAGERISLGVQVERLDGDVDSEEIESSSFFGDQIDSRLRYNYRADRMRFTLGVTRDFEDEKRLGIFYRYGAGNLHSTISPQISSSYIGKTAAQSSEIVVQWRSQLAERLFYGLKGGALLERQEGSLTFKGGERRADLSDTEFESRRLALGVGIGYSIRPQTTIAIDAAGGYATGTSRVMDRYSVSNTVRDFERRFVTLHVGGQTEVGRRFFFNGSLYWNWSKDPFDLSSAFGEYGFRSAWNFGPGWRVTKNINAQYIMSRNSAGKKFSHSVMLRYDFGARDQ